MEDFILREIDRLGEMLLIIARKLGLQEDVMPESSLWDVKDEFDKAVCPINLDALLEQENPVWYLVETEKISDYGLETFIEILFHSDLDEDRKAAILHDALAYLDGKGFFSFKLHALSNSWIRIYLTALTYFSWRPHRKRSSSSSYAMLRKTSLVSAPTPLSRLRDFHSIDSAQKDSANVLVRYAAYIDNQHVIYNTVEKSYWIRF